jgi:hypothetical protein
VLREIDMSKDIANSLAVMQALQAAFNLGPTQRLVIDLEIGSAPRVIRVDLLTKPQADALIKSLSGCNVDVIPVRDAADRFFAKKLGE